MAVITEIPWDDGSGDKIYLTRDASEYDQIVAVTSDANTGAARSKVVTFASGVGNIQRQLTINQDAGIIPEVFTANPSSSGGTSSVSNASRAYTDETSTTYANPRLGGKNVANSWYFKFNTSAIPQNATIESVSCKVKAQLTGTTGITPRTIGLYSNSILKGSTQNLTNSAKIFTFSNVSWTREELSDVRITVNATRTNNNNSPWLYFYGATLTVTYTL